MNMKMNFIHLLQIYICLIYCASLALAQTPDASFCETCPIFDCAPEKYRFGFFKSASSPGPDMSANLLSQVPLGQISGIPPTSAPAEIISILGNSKGQISGLCARQCQDYNSMAAAAGGVLAAYWSLSLYTNKAALGSTPFQGKCFCYGASSCAPIPGKTIYDLRDYPFITSTIWSMSISGSLCVSGGKGDPHFTGADSSHFDFSGVPNKHFALLSDTDLHVNALFGGRYGPRGSSSQKAQTWMRQISILRGTHSLLLEARAGADASYGDGYMQSIIADGKELQLKDVGEKADVFGDGQVELTWLVRGEPEADDIVDKYEVKVKNVMRMVLTLRPEVEALRTEEDGTVHFGVNIVEANFSPIVHGVLGQTYRPDFATRLKRQQLVYDEILKVNVVPGENAEGFLDGNVLDYMVSDVFSYDCKYAMFSPPVLSRKLLR